MEDTLANQYQLMQSIEKILINFKKDGAERKTYSNIQRRLSTLNTYWNEFNSNHQQLIDYQDVEHEYFKQNCYVRTKEFYQRLSTYLEDYSLFLEDPKSHEIPTTPRPGAITTFELPPKVKTSPFKVTPPTIEISRGTPDQAASASSATPTPPVRQFSDTVSTAKQDQKGLTHFLDRSTTSKLEEKLRKQKTSFKAFSRTITNIDFDNLSEKWEFEDILKHVEARWEAVDSLHWEIDSERYGEDEDYERTFNRYEREYNDIKKALNQKMWSVSYKSKTTPTMEIPTFNGDYNKWVSFKDLFTETIHNNRSISNAQKMQYLKSKVKDEAERLIHHLSISTENYQVCWDILNHRYNNKKLIFSSHMNILMSLPIIQQQSSTLIKKIHDTAKECLNAVKNLGVDTSSWGPILVHILSHKLDSETHKDYIESVKNPRDLPSLEEFFEFLENKFTSLEASRRKQDSANQKTSTPSSYNKKKPYQFQHSNYNNHNNYEQRAIGKSLHVSSASKCPHCNGEHGIFNCKQFLDMSNELKLKTVNKLRLCSNCLHDHKNKKCMSTKTCRKCIEPHNTLLHEAFTKSSISNNKKSSDSVHVSQKKSAEVLLATALVKVLAADGTHHRMRALVDQGSQISLITENAAQLLGLPRRHCKGVVFGLGAQQNNSKGALDISVTSMHGNFNFNANVVIMNNLMHNLPNQSFEKPSWPHLEGINLADPEFHTSRPIDMLLGAEIYSLIILGGVVKGNCDEPIAQQTHLGWLLCGNVKTYQCNVVLNNLDDIQRFWTIEDVAEDPVELSAEGHYCIKHYQENTTRRSDGRYVVRYPMKPELSVKLGDSKTRAVAQFLQLEKRLSKNYNLSNSYKAFIHEYINLGHMHDASNDRNITPSLACYLPHHCVLRAESTTTALRVVVNASSPTSSGYSLNDLMYSGPNLQKDLLSLILRWRQYEVAFIADIEKMFRQILIHPQDRNLQKIIWRDDKQEMLREYNLATVTYGTKAAPFLAMMTLKQLAKDEGPKYTLSTAKQALEEEFYMDDLLSGSHSIPAAKQLQSDLLQLFKSGGFNLRKWASNKKELIESVETISSTQSFDFKYPESTKTLGLRWDPKNDDFSFQIKLSPPSEKPLSKRVLLSEISKVFDPLGWLSPVTTKLKLLFQKVWLQNIQWDSNLPEEFNVEWQTIRKDLDNINQIKVRRWLQTQVNDNIELHGFCDSSIKAYACVIYCKLTKQTTDGREYQSINIVAAKSRLVPVNKTITLPRLELMSCLLLSKLIQTVQKSLPHHNIKTFGWTDSTAALGWLQGDTKRWKTFVANRVEQIIAVIPPKQWHYVKSAENPADCASRGITANQLQEHQLWWTGPTWLTSSKIMYHQEQSYVTNLEQKKQSVQTNITTINCENVILSITNKYSDFARATRVLGWVLRAVSFNRPKQSYLTINELSKARHKIIQFTQKLQFEKEINKLKNQEQIDSRSKIYCLRPFLDQNGLLRVGGRITQANIEDKMKHPLIIPHDSHLTNLLIDQAHRDTFHGGPRLTQARLRQRYWIVGGNRAVKKRLRNCVICRRHDPAKQTQLMGDLPAARTNPSRPFLHTGVDFTGYVDVKANKGRGIKTTKGYVAVFVCMATKAVHLELVSDLTSSAFLAALRRMAARRGTPRHVYCDNGTNFVGANHILKQEYINLKAVLDNKFFTQVSDMEIQFSFNCPSHPSAGGLWEAAVKSLKHHLRRVIGEQKLTYEEFSTLLSQLEACLNSRPLCALSEDPEEVDVLTPSHFLASGPTLTLIETEKDMRTRWQLTQKIFNDVWKRWQAEYLCQLSARSKWRQPQRNQQVGDLVIIREPNLPAGKWALGRVVEVHPGKDGYVRVASVKTKGGIIKRPVVKLSTLPINTEITPHEPSTTHTVINGVSNIITNKSKVKTSLNFKTLAITLLTMMLVLPAQSAYNIAQLKNNHSIYFDKISDMHLSRDEWKLIVYYNMNPYWEGNNMLANQINNLEETCQKIQTPSLCNILLLQLRHAFNELEHYNHMLLGQPISKKFTRARRGYINVVGNIANTLFGVLDDRFAEQYQKDIELLRTNQKHQALLWKNQTSVVEAQNNLLQRVEDSMNKQHKLINQHLNNIQRVTNSIQKEIQAVATSSDFALSSIIANSILINLRNIQEYLLNTIVDLHHGTFNFHLITPEQFKDELNVISGLLSKDLSLPINNIPSDLPKLYHLLKVKAKMTKEFFIFEIGIPLVTRDYYEIYHLIPIPHNNQNNMICIKTISNYIAMNIQKDSFLPMSGSDLLRCNRNNEITYLCPLQKPVYRMTSDKNLCEKDELSAQCKTNTIPCKTVWYELHETNRYLYACCGQCTVRVICGNQVSSELLSESGIISLSDGCIIKSQSFTIFSHRQQSNTLKIEADILNIEIPPINHIIELPFPSFNQSNANETHNNQTYIHEQLQEIGKRIQQLKQSETEVILTDRTSTHDVTQYVLIGSLIIIVIGIIFAWRRLHTGQICLSRYETGEVAARAIHTPASSAPADNMTPPPPVRREAPLPPPPQTASSAKPPRFINKATSPICRTHFREHDK